MPESPVFELIARKLGIPGVLNGDPEQWVRDIAEQLRLVWNARGAADLAKVEAILSEVHPPDLPPRVVTMKTFDRALRSLDR